MASGGESNRPRYFYTPEDLQANIVNIPQAGAKNQVQKPDLEDNQKRWLIVGICLHSIISPTLRQYVDPILNALYNILKSSDKIDTQTITRHLKKYPKTSKRLLNYEAINNNTTQKKNTTKYNYKVQDAVDLSKLFLQTPMAEYAAFDDTCDSSALLGIIAEVDTFPPIVKKSADEVRSTIRNPWAHCNFDEWDVIKYQTSFQVMYQFIRNLNHSPQVEAQLLADLTKWETNGIFFLQGTTIGLEVLQEIRSHTSNLSEYCLKLGSDSQFFSQDIYKQVDGFQNEMDTICNRVAQIEYNEKQQGIAMGAITADVDSLKKTTANIETVQTKLTSDQTHIQERLGVVEIATIEVETVIDDVKTDIAELQKYTGYSRPKGKVLFYPPNRIESFVGRKYELQLLEKNFINTVSEQYTQAIYGLGGCGKTTLSIEFAWLLQSFYKGGVFWMSAENSSSLEDSIYKLAVDANSVGNSANETMHKTLKWLSMLQDRWLLVVDNVDEADLSANVKELLLGTWKRNAKSHIIITSRRNEDELQELLHLNSKQCTCLEVFTVTEGEYFMKRRTHIDSVLDDENITELVKELDGLPLALEQAAAHIKSLKCSFKDYLDKFKKKRVFLLNSKKAKSDFATDKMRLNVMTTWQLNLDYINAQSEEEGLGSAAVSVMEISAFLFADNIPVHIINIGKPIIANDDLVEALEDTLGVNQVVEILTRFSLFQCVDKERLSVHRLVQEVIRHNMRNDDSKMKNILQCATRMINAALAATASPYDVIAEGKNEVVKRGSLQLWSDLAVNADVLKGHVLQFAQKKDKGICTNIETTRIIQTTAIYNSIHQRQDQALSDQDQMIHLLSTFDNSPEDFEMLTCIKIPVFEKERIMIQDSIASVIHNETEVESVIGNSLVPYTTNQLRLKGNEAFREKRHQDAIQYYTEGLRTYTKDTIDAKLLSNRSLVYLKVKDFEKALIDANRCIELSPGFWKGYCWKAYAIANLVRIGVLPSTMEAVGLASASVAAQLNEECLLEYKMKIHYPVLVYKMVQNTDSLGKEIMDITERSYTTLLLRKGKYSIHKREQTICTKSIQVIGIEDGVEIDTGPDGFHMFRPPNDAFRFKFIPEQKINVHFENIFFVSEGGQICVSDHVNATFYRCKFSNGDKGCAKFPYCTAGEGCINPSECLVKHNAKMAGVLGLHLKPVGQVGCAGICSTGYGKVLIDTCIMDACGGGGALCNDDNATLEIRNSTVTNMIQSGIEARNGGTVKAENNVIIDNNFHGFAIGPRGHAQIKANIIQGNGCEGIWSGGKADDENDLFLSTLIETSTAVITENVIRQNGLSGMSFDGGSFEVTRNKIADNWLWGIMVKSRSSATINNNDIFKNKCGAIRIGLNYSASVMCDGNTIRDHTGPAIYVIRSPDEIMPMQNKLRLESVLGDETTFYNKFPILTNRNVWINNDSGVQHPSKSNQLIKTCAWCHNHSKTLKHCGKCQKASYCSKDCQAQHWRKHMHRCKLLQLNYTIEIPMKTTKPFGIAPAGLIGVRIFNPDLKGIKEGPPPDRTGSKQFIVKVQNGSGEYTAYNPNADMLLYDQSVTLDIMFPNPTLYHMVHECGILAGEKLSVKKIFCWAFFKQKGSVLCIHTDNLPPFQTW